VSNILNSWLLCYVAIAIALYTRLLFITS